MTYIYDPSLLTRYATLVDQLTRLADTHTSQRIDFDTHAELRAAQTLTNNLLFLLARHRPSLRYVRSTVRTWTEFHDDAPHPYTLHIGVPHSRVKGRPPASVHQAAVSTLVTSLHARPPHDGTPTYTSTLEYPTSPLTVPLDVSKFLVYCLETLRPGETIRATRTLDIDTSGFTRVGLVATLPDATHVTVTRPLAPQE